MKLILLYPIATMLLLNLIKADDENVPQTRGKRTRKLYEKLHNAFDINNYEHFIDPIHTLSYERLAENLVNGALAAVTNNRLDKAQEKVIANLLDSNMMNEDDRNLNCINGNCNVPLTLRGVWGYGCWCNFGADILKGRGTAVNEHDSACERMQKCLRCARQDGIEAGYDCDPKNSVYNAQYFPVTASNSLNSGCAIQNGGDLCGTHVCTCEMQFINDILDLVWSGYTYDPSFSHPENPMGGSFDDEANCPISPGDSELACCGQYPLRFPYNIIEKECCTSGLVDDTFNPFTEVCCPSGVQAIHNGGC